MKTGKYKKGNAGATRVLIGIAVCLAVGFCGILLAAAMVLREAINWTGAAWISAAICTAGILLGCLVGQGSELRIGSAAVVSAVGVAAFFFVSVIARGELTWKFFAEVGLAVLGAALSCMLKKRRNGGYGRKYKFGSR